MKDKNFRNNDLITFIKSGIRFRTRKLIDPIIRKLYYPYMCKKVKDIRNKEYISVVFIISEIGLWKTECLYLEMLRHKRFAPILLLTPLPDVPEGINDAIKYLKQKNYSFHLLQGNETIQSVAHPDIIFYQKPYDASIMPRYGFRRNLRSLFCYVYYSFHNVNEREITETPLTNIAWQVYFESEEVMEYPKKIMKNKGRNSVFTGLPMTDILTQPHEFYDNPWKNTGKYKKKIIWAPHHSVGDEYHGGINYSNFLEMADYMLEFAKEYRDQVQFAFKPHSLLKFNLKRFWDERRIEDYYKAWEEMDNTQLELGAYNGLFMNSDAMIHDSGSFTTEYLYTKKPVMFVIKDPNVDHTANQSQWGKNAFMLHYHGYNKDDVRKFIEQVISGKDPMKDRREEYYNTNLLPPNGKTASENIINAILGI